MGKTTSLLFIMILILSVTSSLIQAQDGTVTISLTVPQFFEDVFSDDIIAQFEAENPDIRVHIINPPGFGVPFSGNEAVEDYLDAVEDYVSSADVVLVDSDALLPEATRAGYFLDLFPLVNTDPGINSADYHGPVWGSFQWDGGMWAIPVAMDATMIFFDQEAFDRANLAYPSATWTMTDYEYTVRELTQFNPDGSTEMPGWINSGGDFGMLFLAAIGDSILDTATLPNMPYLDNPALEEVLEILAEMYRDGLMDIPEDVDPQDVPLQLGRVAFNMGGFVFGSAQKEAALLPAGRAGLVLDAYAISSGTQHPEAAYRLVSFLSYSPEAVVGNSRPARLSLQGATLDDVPEFAQRFFSGTSAETEAMIDQGFENGIATGEARFSRYLEDAVSKMVLLGLDARTALDEVELEILDRLAVADSRRDSVQFIVEPPPPPIVLAPGEIRLSFGVSSFITPLPNEDAWEEATLDFVFNDAEVGDIVLDTTFPGDLSELTAAYDCFYQDSNAVPSADLSLLRSLDPLMNSDPTFNADDIVGTALMQVQRNNQTWAMPLVIQPSAMRFNPNLFAQAGVFPPVGTGWTVDQFEDAMRTLSRYLPEDDAPYEPREFGNSYLLILMAAYGGLPFDYRTDPVTLNFTDTATIEAIRSVLDLAKDGYIAYRPLASVGGFDFSFGSDAETALYSEVLNIFSMAANPFIPGVVEDEMPNILTIFPEGSQFAAVSYDVGGAYVSASSQHAEACYRFISHIAQQPDLFTVMPARRSHLDSFEVETAQGAETVTFYRALDSMMRQPNTISVPALQLSFEGILKVFETFWLNRAFDRYVLNDADLETELADAELFTQAFLDCQAAVPPFDPTIDEPQTYFTQFAQCAFRIDPSVIGFFSDE